MDPADPFRQDSATAQAVTRRGFLVATAAGATLAQGCASRQPHPGNGGGPLSKKRRPTCVAAVPGGRAVTCDDHGKVYVWNIKDLSDRPEKLKDGGFKGAYVTVGVTGPQSKRPRVFCGSYDGEVEVWDLDPVVKRATFTGHVVPDEDVEVWVVAAHPARSEVLSVDNGGRLIHWKTDGRTCTPLHDVNIGDGPVGGLAFVPGKDQFLTTHTHGITKLWELSSLKQVALFKEPTELAINSVAVGPGDVAVTGGFHKVVAKLDLRGPFPPPPATAPDPVPLFTHSHRVWRVAVSPEGVVASADDGGNVHLAKPDGTQRDWNEPGGVMGVAFSIEAPRRLIYTTGTLADPLIRVVDVP